MVIGELFTLILKVKNHGIMLSKSTMLCVGQREKPNGALHPHNKKKTY